MKRVAVLGHFDIGKNMVCGQTIKTKILGSELKKMLGDDNVVFYDTAGGWKFILSLPFLLVKMLWGCENVILLPAYKAVYILVPAITMLNLFFHRRIHYAVIGGRLPSLVQRFPWLKFFLRELYQIYPETQMILDGLKRERIENAVVMPNFKPLDIIAEDDLQNFEEPPFPLCTFSRVESTKGIEDAINAVRACNQKVGRVVFTLDIYGRIQDETWFNTLMQGQPDEIRYGGVVPFDQSTEILSRYFVLLFPTYYVGEGFAGTLIDAFAAGVPAIASDWNSNPEIVEQGKSGFLYTARSVEELTELLVSISIKPDVVNSMRQYCIQKALQYQPSIAMAPLIERLA
ncbi:MAG: glycosyltransferase [Bacteroidaceae bacterium]|nr:glycosyltransferase [Bacteroidaceae bacterium]